MLRSGLFVKGILLVVFVVGLVGCASNKLKKENEGYKQEILRLNEQNANLDQENKRLADEKASLERELETTKSTYPARASELEGKSRVFSGMGLGVSVRDNMVIVTLPQTLLYSSGSAKITTSGRSKLAQVAKSLNGSDFKDFTIEVQGHTDTDPIVRTKDKYRDNWELSYVRAQNVADYLIESGKVSAKRIHVSAYSQYNSVASNATSAGKAKNRRVEIVLTAPATKVAAAKPAARAAAPAEPAMEEPAAEEAK